MEQTRFNGVTCRGAYAFGTACGHCERCAVDPANPAANVASQRKDAPNTEQGDARALYEQANAIRSAMKSVAKTVDDLRGQIGALITPDGDRAGARAKGEAIVNATLAYQHIEDASMRLGKVLQALDGGVSVYDRATTVGATTVGA